MSGRQKFKAILKRWRWLVAGAVLLVLIKAGLSFFSADSDLEVLRTVKSDRGDLVVSVSATGEVKPYNRVEVKPPIAGRVEQVLVREGQEVKQGQVVAWMSSVERAALLDAARSQDEETFRRWESAYKAAPLTAPLDGTIIVRAVEPGQTVGTTDPVVVISDRLIVEGLVDETDLSQIELGQKTEIFMDAYPDRHIFGRVDHISYESRLLNNVNVYAITIIPDEIPPVFRSGMTANVTFIVSERKNVVLVPSEAIAEWPRQIPKPEATDFAVYQRKKRAPVPVPVKIGDSDGKNTEILKGLEAGENILVVRKKEVQMKGAFSPFPQRPASQQRRRS